MSDLQLMFDGLVDLTEPICQRIDKEKAAMLLFNTSGLEAYVTENNPKYANCIIKQLKFFKEANDLGIVRDISFYNQDFPEFKLFFNERLSKTAFYLLEKYGSSKKMAHMNSASYEKLGSLSKGKFSPPQFLKLKELASNSIGVNNSIFVIELDSLLTLHKFLVREIDALEKEIHKLIDKIDTSSLYVSSNHWPIICRHNLFRVR